MTQTWKWKCALRAEPDHASRGAHEGRRWRLSGHRDRLPGSPAGAWSEWRVEGHRAERGRAAQRRRSWGCGAGTAEGASERRAPIGAREAAAGHDRRYGPRSRPYDGHYTTDMLHDWRRRTRPESRSHNQHTGLVRIRERECRSAGRPGSRARPMRARRLPWDRTRRPVRGTSRGGSGPADRAASGWDGAGGRRAHSLASWAEGAGVIEG